MRRRTRAIALVAVALLIALLGWRALSGRLLIAADEAGSVSRVNLLLALGADPNARAKEGHAVTPLQHAAWAGHVEVARVLLDHGADVNAVDECGKTALHWAAECGHTDVVKLLLDRGADVTVKDRDDLSTPMARAAEADHREVVILLLEHGADPNADNDGPIGPPLEYAEWFGDKELAAVLRQHGAKLPAAPRK